VLDELFEEGIDAGEVKVTPTAGRERGGKKILFLFTGRTPEKQREARGEK